MIPGTPPDPASRRPPGGPRPRDDRHQDSHAGNADGRGAAADAGTARRTRRRDTRHPRPESACSGVRAHRARARTLASRGVAVGRGGSPDLGRGLAGVQLRLRRPPPGVSGAVRAAQALSGSRGRAPGGRICWDRPAGCARRPRWCASRDGGHVRLVGERGAAQPVRVVRCWLSRWRREVTGRYRETVRRRVRAEPQRSRGIRPR